MNIPDIEVINVINTYNNISKKWDDTRYMVWPDVKTYLDNIKKNSKVVEIGCGNGKNM